MISIVSWMVFTVLWMNSANMLENRATREYRMNFALSKKLCVILFTLLFLTPSFGQHSETPDSSALSQTIGAEERIDRDTDLSKEGGWIQWKRFNVLVIVGVFFLFVLILTRWAQRGKELRVKEIAGIQAVEHAIGKASETGKPIVYVPGVFDVDNIQTIASMAILVHVAKKAAEKDVRLIVPLNRAFLIALAEESVKKGMDEAGKSER